MAVNNFLPFAPTDTGTNLLTQVEYAADSERTIGNQPGQARSELVNKALRQSAAISSAMGATIGTITGTDALDDAIAAKLQQQITASIMRLPPVLSTYTAGSGAHNCTVYFFIATGSATVAATYTNNGITYTVKATVASGTLITMTGNGLPEVSGTLTKASGTGDSTLTFYAMRVPLVLVAEGIGGGGGGGGSSPANAGASGASGGTTSFGTALLAGSGGTGGAQGGAPTPGGGGSVSSPAVGYGLGGGSGQGGDQNSLAFFCQGGQGGTSFFGGGGGGGVGNGNGGAAAASSGSGGGGAGSAVSTNGSSGGAAGGYFYGQVSNPSMTYSYTVGGAGAGGSGVAAFGGDGAAGRIFVRELYQ